MTAIQHQLLRAAQELPHRQRKPPGAHQGGWGVLAEPDAPASLVNTAEAVCVLAACGLSEDDGPVVDGLSYLREKVTLHVQGEGQHPEARGRKARYAAYGLLGLTAFAGAFDSEAHQLAAAACVRWLAEHQTADSDEEGSGVGWAEVGRQSSTSVLSTAVAAMALDRVPAGVPGTQDSRKMAGLARRRLRYLARGTADQKWWPMWTETPDASSDEAASCALTALAVLALAEGGPLSQASARAGVAWLLANRARWQEHTEPEYNVECNWVHLSCLLGIRAVLVPCALVDPTRHELHIAISYLDRLWSESDGEWRHGHPSARVTTTGDFMPCTHCRRCDARGGTSIRSSTCWAAIGDRLEAPRPESRRDRCIGEQACWSSCAATAARWPSGPSGVRRPR